MSLVAAGAPGLPSRVLDQRSAVINLASPTVGRAVMGFFAVLVAMVVVIAFWPGERTSLPPRPKVSIARVLIAMLFFAAILSVFRVAFPETGDEAVAIPETTAVEEAEPLQWGFMLLAGALGAMLFALIALGGRLARDRPATFDPGQPAEPNLGGSTVVRISGVVVGSEEEHRRRVILLYSSMLADLERRGLGRHPHEAPGEYVARVAADPSVGEEAVRRLTDLFGVAAFSTHPITETTVAEAGAAASVARHEVAP